MNHLSGRVIALLILTTLTGGSLFADQLHYKNIIIGDRAAGLAGAYSAIADDASGLYYNPAGIVFSKDLQLSASANALHSSSLKYKNVLNGTDWKRESSTIVPNFFGMTTKLGPGYFGFSYAVTDFDVEDQDTVLTSIPGISTFVLNLNNTDKVTKLGPSYAIQINDQWNVGVSLYLHDREQDLVQSQFIRLSNNRFESSDLFIDASETGIEPILGVMWSPRENWSVGASIRQVKIISSETRVQNFCSSDVNDATVQPSQCLRVDASVVDPSIVSNKDKRELPVNTRIGVAYFPSPKFLISSDLSYFSSVDSDAFKAESVLNISIGVEYYYNASWALRGGIFTNNSNASEIDPNISDQSDHVDLTGLSLSLSKFSRTSSITVGYAGSSGSGEAQVIAGNTAIQTLDQSMHTLYLSTSYRF